MAVTESVKIVFEVDNSPLQGTVDKLAAVGKVSQEDAAKFKQLSDASKVAGSSMTQAAKGATDLAAAEQKVSKSTTEVVNSAKGIKDIGKSFDGAADAAEATAEAFVPLRTRLRDAKNELAQLEEEFGTFSNEANAARARAGELADQMSDLNRQVNLLNPESKIQAFTTLGQGIVGAFSVATGAIQAFGGENEQVQQIAQKLQGALNIVQGVQSIIQLKEAYQDVKAVLGFTTAAQTALTGATTAGAAATTGAATATRGFAAALTSTGIGAIVVAIGALVGAFLLYSSSSEEAKENEEALKAAQDASKDSTDRLRQAVGELQVARGQKTEEQLKKENLQAESLERQVKLQETLSGAIIEQTNAQKEFDKFQKNFNSNAKDLAKTRLDAANAAVKQSKDSITNELLALDASKKLVDEEKNKKDAIKATEDAKKAAAKAEQLSEEAITKRLQALAEEQKVRQFSVDLNKEYGATEEEITRQKIFNNQLDQEGLNAILKQAQGTKQYESVQAQVNEKIREEILLRKQLEKQLEVQLIPANRIADQQDKINKKLAEEVPQRKSIGITATDLNNQLFKQEEDFAALQQQRIDRSFTIANEVSTIFIEANQRQTEEELASLEEKRAQGLITEEQYEIKVRQLKNKSAEDQKKAQVFQATMSAAQAILSALTIVADPATKAAAVAFAATVGALNLAKIIATPIPKFQQGTLSVPGHDFGRDSVHAMLRPGEAVIPTETNREYHPVIKAIYTRQVSSKELNEFVNSRMRKVTDEPVFNFNPVTLDALFKRDLKVSNFNSSVVRASGGTVTPNVNVNAKIDTYALTKAMSKNKTVELGNPEVVAKLLAAELAKTNNPRRQ